MIASDFQAPTGELRPKQFGQDDINTLLGAWLSQASAQLLFYTNDGVVFNDEPTLLEGQVYPNQTDALTAAFVYWRAYTHLCDIAKERPISGGAGSINVRYGDANTQTACQRAETYRRLWLYGTGQTMLRAMY